MAVSSITAGEVYMTIAEGGTITRSTLMSSTGLSRSTIADRLDRLSKAGLIREGGSAHGSGGRPSKLIRINEDRFVVVAVDVGEIKTRVALMTVDSRVLADFTGEVDIQSGPGPVLQWVACRANELLAESGKSTRDVLGIGFSLRAPVDFAAGQVSEPSVMTGWDGVDIETEFRALLDIPVLVENDVNARGYGEELLRAGDCDNVFFVKAGTGIGSAIITHGELFRGAQGAAGDIGHIRIEPDSDLLCRCGAVGCVEAYSAGWALVRAARQIGLEVRDVEDFVRLARAENAEAVHLLRQAGRMLGRAIAYSVNLLNPECVIVGGLLVAAGDHLLLGIRESVYQYSLPLATRELRVEVAEGYEQATVVGVSRLVAQSMISAETIDRMLETL